MKLKSSGNRISIKNDISELPKITGFVNQLKDQFSINDKVIHDINLVLEELISNIIFYAYDDDKSHEIEIQFQYTKEDLFFKIVDDGQAFDPVNSSPEVDLEKNAEERNIGGLGIHFVKTLTDHIEYQRKGGFNILLIKKKI